MRKLRASAVGDSTPASEPGVEGGDEESGDVDVGDSGDMGGGGMLDTTAGVRLCSRAQWIISTTCDCDGYVDAA